MSRVCRPARDVSTHLLEFIHASFSVCISSLAASPRVGGCSVPRARPGMQLPHALGTLRTPPPSSPRRATPVRRRVLWGLPSDARTARGSRNNNERPGPDVAPLSWGRPST